VSAVGVETRSRVAVREAFGEEPPCNGRLSGPEFKALVRKCVGNIHDGSEEAVLRFINNCNESGMTTEQLVAASWIRQEILSPSAKVQEKARLDMCGSSAEELWGAINMNPQHPERKKFTR